MVNIYEHYKDINFNQLSPEQFLIDYNNFMKQIYNTICSKYNNDKSLNKADNVDQIEKQDKQEVNIENNIYYNTFCHNLNSIQIDV
jgi:hypothetical protein